MGRTGRVLLVALNTLIMGCADDAATPQPTPDSALPAPSGTVLVAAAASLTDVFTELAEQFEAEYPGVDVELSVGGSSSLALSIEEGSPFDVFASANGEVMAGLDAGGLVAGEPIEFATNTLAIAVPAGSSAVGSIDDFVRGELFLGACAAQVPCGAYADELFAAAGVTPALDTRESDVRALVTKLVAGELDAGIVYTSDVAAFPDELDTVGLPDGIDVEARYPIATLDSAPNPDGAQAFVAFVTGDGARTALERAGFGVP